MDIDLPASGGERRGNDPSAGGISVGSADGMVALLAAAGFIDAVPVGRGGFGVVYHCRQVRLGRSVAVKVLTAQLDDNRARFMREQQAMGQLTGHPNIVPVLQVGEIAGGQPFLVMPFCGRGSLADRIAETGTLGIDEALRVGVKIAAALESAHRLGIVHRDVKPANILVTDYGEPALCDFGIARFDEAGYQTASGYYVGSPAYTAPEIISGDPPSSASDVYGLGATLYCGLSGHAAFERCDGEQLVAQFARIAQHQLPDLREQQVADDVATIVELAMSRNPRDRPTAQQLGELVQHIQAGRGLHVDAMALHGDASSPPRAMTTAPTPAGPSTAVSAAAAASTTSTPSAEYKQVTVLFADVVGSMDLAAALSAERFREIITELADRASAMVRRYGGTVDKFTGDGIMAVFGAPTSLEDHALRACLAGLGIQEDAMRLAVDVEAVDGVDFQLRVGLNSGEVIAGEIGAGGLGYSAVGTAVGMAQRMESVAPPGAVLLSESTARLVEHTVALDEPQWVEIKGAAKPVCTRRLRGQATRGETPAGMRSTLIGRELEMHTVAAVLDRAVSGRGCVVNVVGPAGIGKTRLVDEAVELAKHLGIEVFWTYCESHASDIAFTVVARLVRAVIGLNGLDGAAARARVRTRVLDADPDDLVLLDDLLGIADPETASPKIDPDARRRRLTALVNAAQLARTEPVLFIVEDAHWIDEVSESMLADFLAVIPHTPALVITTYRPEYRGALTQLPAVQTLSLTALTDTETAALLDELLGADPSVRALRELITARTGGNPFFAEEIVRDLADRAVLAGERGAYLCHTQTTDVRVPATLQAAIGARIDRLGAGAKQTLNAAAVIGSRFTPDLLADLGITPVLDELVKAELVDQVGYTGRGEYAFHHPLIRTVAYETQLKADRDTMHRHLAATIETGQPDSIDANAALIAEHLQAAGEAHAAYGWHMRAGAWANTRDTLAARVSWERAQQIADALPTDDPNQLAMRIAPRTMLCVIGYRVRGQVAGTRFDELRELCVAAGDKRSLAIGMAALATEYLWYGRIREASRTASECFALVDTIGDAALTVGLSFLLVNSKIASGETSVALRWSQTAIDMAEGDPVLGNFTIGSPLASAMAGRAVVRAWMGDAGWCEDVNDAVDSARATDGLSHALVVFYIYGCNIAAGILVADDIILREIGDALQTAERLGDDFALSMATDSMGLALVHRASPADRARGVELLTRVRDMVLQGRACMTERPVVEVYAAREQARCGNLDGAIAIMRTAVNDLFRVGQSLGWGIPTSGVLVETLLERGTEEDKREAAAAIDRLATAPGDDLAVRDITLLRLRMLLARALGDDAAYRELVHRYRAIARSLGFQGHIAWAEALP